MANDVGLSSGLMGTTGKEAPISRKAGDSELKGMHLAPTFEEISRLAHRFWEERGCPEGSAEDDWLRAEKSLASRPSQ